MAEHHSTYFLINNNLTLLSEVLLELRDYRPIIHKGDYRNLTKLDVKNVHEYFSVSRDEIYSINYKVNESVFIIDVVPNLINIYLGFDIDSFKSEKELLKVLRMIYEECEIVVTGFEIDIYIDSYESDIYELAGDESLYPIMVKGGNLDLKNFSHEVNGFKVFTSPYEPFKRREVKLIKFLQLIDPSFNPSIANL